MTPRRIVLTGGRGFVGSTVAHRLAAAGHDLVIPSRSPHNAGPLGALPNVAVVAADIHDDAELDRLFADADAVINFVGVLHSKSGDPWGPDFNRAHVTLPRRIVAACQRQNVARLLHISALGAGSDAPSQYQRSKAAGENEIRAAGDSPAWTMLRPSVIFGPGDSFLNLFDTLTRYFPVLPLAGAHARFQPVYVEDVAEVMVRCLDTPATAGQIFELGGPRQYTLKELVETVCRLTGRKRLVVPLPESLGMAQAALLECLPQPPMSRDNLRSMRVDNITHGAPLPFGLEPHALEDIAPGYLGAKQGGRD